MWFLRRISLRHARAHKLRTLLAATGIGIGASTIIATSTMMGAAMHSFEKLVQALAGDADLHVANGTVGVPEELAAELSGVRTLMTVAPLLQGAVTRVGEVSESLDVFGVDMLGDRPWSELVPRAAVRIPDEAQFVLNDDSIVVSSTYAAAQRLGVGSRFEVLAPSGRRTLVVRGTVTHPDLERLLGDRFVVMDLPAAQSLLDKRGRYDRIDLRVVPGADPDAARAAIDRLLAGRATVAQPDVYGRNSTTTLATLDASLQVCAMLTLMVGFFIIYHTISVSIAERAETLHQLRRIGVSARAIRGGFLAEAALLGTFAGIVAVPLGTLLAWLSFGVFQQATSNWMRLPRPQLEMSSTHFIVAMVVSVCVSCAATMLALRRALDGSVLSAQPALGGAAPRTRAPLRIAVAGALIAVVEVAVGLQFDRPLPVAARAFYLMSVNGGMQVAIGLTAPALLIVLAFVAARAAAARSWVSLKLAAATVLRDSGSPTAVVMGIVIALGASLSIAVLIASVKTTFLDLVAAQIPCDVMLTAADDLTRMIPRSTVPAEVVDGIERMDGVERVQTLRTTYNDVAGRSVVLQGMDLKLAPTSLVGVHWDEVAAEFHAGEGVLVSDTFAQVSGLRRGDTIELRTPVGLHPFRVLAIWRDIFGGDVGAVSVDAQRYREIWNDPAVNRLFITATRGTSPVAMSAEIQHRYGVSYRLRVVTMEETRAAVRTMVDESFAGAYALLLLMISVAMLGVVNFLLAALVSRRRAFRLLHALGLSAAQMRRTLVAEASLIGAVAVVLGLVGGALAGLVLVDGAIPALYGWRFDLVIPIGSAAGLAGFTILLALAASVVPARLSLRTSTLQRGERP